MSGVLILTRPSCSPRASWLHHTCPVQEKISIQNVKTTCILTSNSTTKKTSQIANLQNQLHSRNYFKGKNNGHSKNHNKRQEDGKEASGHGKVIIRIKYKNDKIRYISKSHK